MSFLHDSNSKNSPSNVYSLFGQTQSVESKVPVSEKPFSSSKVLKAEDLNQSAQVESYQPKKLLVPTPSVIVETVSKNVAIQDLKNNLNQLKTLHSRLRFMLQELESFIDE